jgi:hypothetical protein
MVQYTIELTDAESKALGFVAASQQEWIENAIKVRCALAIEDIVKREVDRKLSLNETISGSKEDIVNAADLSIYKQEINGE